jgi:hypothetical protein
MYDHVRMKKDTTSALNTLAARIDAFAPEYAGPLMVKGDTLMEQAYPEGYLTKMYMKSLPWIRKYLMSWEDTFDWEMNLIHNGLVGIQIKCLEKKTGKECSLTIMIWGDYTYHLMNPIEDGADSAIPYTISEKDFINTLHYALKDTADFFYLLDDYKKHKVQSTTRYGPKQVKEATEFKQHR